MPLPFGNPTLIRKHSSKLYFSLMLQKQTHRTSLNAGIITVGSACLAAYSFLAALAQFPKHLVLLAIASMSDVFASLSTQKSLTTFLCG